MTHTGVKNALKVTFSLTNSLLHVREDAPAPSDQPFTVGPEIAVVDTKILTHGIEYIYQFYATQFLPSQFEREELALAIFAKAQDYAMRPTSWRARLRELVFVYEPTLYPIRGLPDFRSAINRDTFELIKIAPAECWNDSAVWHHVRLRPVR